MRHGGGTGRRLRDVTAHRSQPFKLASQVIIVSESSAKAADKSALIDAHKDIPAIQRHPAVLPGKRMHSESAFTLKRSRQVRGQPGTNRLQAVSSNTTTVDQRHPTFLQATGRPDHQGPGQSSPSDAISASTEPVQTNSTLAGRANLRHGRLSARAQLGPGEVSRRPPESDHTVTRRQSYPRPSPVVSRAGSQGAVRSGLRQVRDFASGGDHRAIRGVRRKFCHTGVSLVGLVPVSTVISIEVAPLAEERSASIFVNWPTLQVTC
jgi:hypothetical protein